MSKHFLLAREIQTGFIAGQILKTCWHEKVEVERIGSEKDFFEDIFGNPIIRSHNNYIVITG